MDIPLRILLVSPSYKPAYVYGGPMRSIIKLCESLIQMAVSVGVLTTTANGKEELKVQTNHEYQIEGVSVRYFRRWSGDHTHFTPGLLLVLLRQSRQYDVIHIQSWWNLVSVFSTCICLLKGVMPIISIRGTLSAHSFSHNHTFSKKTFHMLLGKYLLRKSLLHATSAKESEEIESVVPNAKRIVLPNVLELHEGTFEVPTDNHGTFQMLFVGRIHPIKNLELLFETLQQMQGTLKWKLSIIGSGDQDYEEKLKRHTAAIPQICWLGEVDGERKFEYMAKADLLVLLSHSENFGNVVIEALSQGTAVLLSKNVGVADYIFEKKLGWIIEPTPQECLRVIREIAHDKDARKQIRIRAVRRIKEDFGTETVISKYIEMYSEVRHQFKSGGK